MRTCTACGNSEPDNARFLGRGAASFAATPEPEQTTAWPVIEALAPQAPAQTVAAPLPAIVTAPVQSPPPMSPRRRSRRGSLVATAVVLIVAAGGATLLLTGTLDGAKKPSTLDDTTFWTAVNSPAMRGITTVDIHAQATLLHRPTDAAVSPSLSPDTSARLNDDASTLTSDTGIARAQLRSLTRLSAVQIADRHVLQSFIAANRHYAATILRTTAGAASLADIQSAGAAAAATDRVARSALPQATSLPSPSVFTVATPTTPSPTIEQTTPIATSTIAVAYVGHVDDLLNASHLTLQAVKVFAPDVNSGRLTTDAAVVQAGGFVATRQQMLESALGLQPPVGLVRSQQLLLRSLRLSLNDDKALLVWVRARRYGDAQAQLDRVNQIGAETTAAKRRFLAVYGPAREAGTGQLPSSLPDNY